MVVLVVYFYGVGKSDQRRTTLAFETGCTSPTGAFEGFPVHHKNVVDDEFGVFCAGDNENYL